MDAIPSGRDFVPARMSRVGVILVLDTRLRKSIIQPEPLNPEVVNERIKDATRGIPGIRPVLGIIKAAGNTQTVLDDVDMWTAMLQPLKAFNSVAGRIGDIHPYLKGAVTILTGASQADRDTAVYSLLEKISEVYTLMTEEEELKNIVSVLPIYLKIAQQTQECADFIVHYSETKSRIHHVATQEYL